MDYGKMTLDEIKKGYRYDKETARYIINDVGFRIFVQKERVIASVDYLFTFATAPLKRIILWLTF